MIYVKDKILANYRYQNRDRENDFIDQAYEEVYQGSKTSYTNTNTAALFRFQGDLSDYSGEPSKNRNIISNQM